MIDFDVILEKIGGLGRYQVLLVAMVCYYSIPSGFNSLAPVFMNYKPEYRCKVPPIDSNFNLTENEILNLTTPVDASGAYATCQRYGYNLSLCETDLSCVNKSAGPIQCDLGYHYDTSIFPQTVITEFNLVCDQAYLDPVATSIYMVGVLIGSIVFGIISDKWGRKPTMISTAVLGFAALIGTSFVHNYWLFVFCRFVVAFLGYGTYLSSFVYLLEITSNKWRTLIGVSFQLVFAVGYMILSGIAYYWRNWHKMNFVTGVLGLPYAVFLIFIPESPRWLFSNGKEEEGKKISRKFAKYNKVELDENIIWKEAEMSAEKKKEENSVKEDSRTYSTVDLFRTRGIRIISFKVMFNWFVNSMVYYGISLNAGSLAGDIFVNNTLNGVMEIVSYIFIILLMDWTGRRFMLTFMMALASLGLLSSTIVNVYSNDDQALITLGVVFAFAAKVGIAGSYAIIYNLTSELYPTVVRSNGVGLGSTAARIGSILAPLLIATQNYVAWLPNVIFGVAAAIAGALSYSFPETAGVDMMESIEEAEAFYSGRRRPQTKNRDTSLSYSDIQPYGENNKAYQEDLSTGL